MKHKYGGMTLVETLVAVMIVSILSLSLYTVFKSGMDAWTKSETGLEAYQNARSVLDQISREISGAFVSSGANGARLTGIDGGAGSDRLTFVTEFAGSVYKINYYLIPDALDPSRKNLMRDYIDYNADVGLNYASTTYPHSVKLVGHTKGVMVDDIEFTYLAQTGSPNFFSDWGSDMDEWPAGEPVDTLPEAVKIVMTLKDFNGKPYPFETIVYLANSETE